MIYTPRCHTLLFPGIEGVDLGRRLGLFLSRKLRNFIGNSFIFETWRACKKRNELERKAPATFSEVTAVPKPSL